MRADLVMEGDLAGRPRDRRPTKTANSSTRTAALRWSGKALIDQVRYSNESCKIALGDFRFAGQRQNLQHFRWLGDLHVLR